MQPLEKSLRNRLEKIVKEAREISESAARAVLEQLGVGEGCGDMADGLAKASAYLGDEARSFEHRAAVRKLRFTGVAESAEQIHRIIG